MQQRLRCRVLIVLCLLGGAVGSASGQTVTGLTPRQVLLGLTNAAGEGSGVSNVGEVIADLVGLEVSTAPIGSSAGGFTFTFDPVTRSFARAAPSFGPMFGERAVTAGEGRAGFGVNYVRATYDRLDGVDLGDGSLRSVGLLAGTTPVATGATQLTITTDTIVLFTNVALNAWFDASVAVPFIRMQLEGTHEIADQRAQGTASASGIGDVAVRAKVRLYERNQGGVALGVDLRVPTGDPQAMLGAGVTRALASGIWSAGIGTLAPHASFGFEYWSSPFQIYDPLQQAGVNAGRHATVYDAGLEWAATARLTVNGEFMGRYIHNGGRLAYRDLPLPANPFGITTASIATVDPIGLHRVSAAGGVKWNFAHTALLTATLVVPMNDAGLRDRLTPIVGLDWGF
jgi:hypothetical protein